ncbi:LptA/OstA family protein [Synechococcus sp. PCC 7336]|uniref:LptA/OstA family protein n=1 Tax=Synechococcus sp. PCC 7336 TaxID=195250 RepID=UPI00035EA067|nr:LptA/OstA family protein [Synechococcus sp. PCC 7336]
MLPLFRPRLQPYCSGVVGLAVLAIAGLSWNSPIWAQENAAPAPADRALTVISDVQTANADTGVIVATGNVIIRYPSREVEGISEIATYYTKEQRIVMEGNVDITQGPNRLQAETVTYLVELNTIEALPAAGQQVESIYVFPSDEGDATTAGEVPEGDNSEVDVEGAISDAAADGIPPLSAPSIDPPDNSTLPDSSTLLDSSTP